MKDLKILLAFSILFIIMSSAFSSFEAVHAIDVSSVSVGTATAPVNLVYDSGKGEIFVVNQLSGTVSVLSEINDAVIATVSVGDNPIGGIAYDSATSEIFVTCVGPPFPEVQVISDTNNSIVATVTTGIYPEAISYDSGKGELFVSNGGGTVSVISDSNNSVVANIPVGEDPDGSAYDSALGEIFVANYHSCTVSVISDSNNTVVATIPVGISPQSIAYDPSANKIYVTDFGSNTVSVISDRSNSVVSTVAVGAFPEGVAYDPVNSEVFVANSVDDTISVISDINDSVVATMLLGPSGGLYSNYPDGLAYDSGRDEMFVADWAGNSVQILTNLSVLPNLTSPIANSSPGSIVQGQSSTLTSTAITTGNSPYLHQWFAAAPGAVGFSAIAGANSPTYNFTTTAYTAIGNWTFILEVTDSSGDSVNSTTAVVFINAPLTTVSPTPFAPTPLSSGTSTAIVSNNSATMYMSSTGVNLTVHGSSFQDGTKLNATSTYYASSQPSGTGTVKLSETVFYEVSLASSSALDSDVSATVSITNPSFNSSDAVEYWNGGAWVSVPTVFTTPATVSATIPASALTGTPIAVGVPKRGTASKSNFTDILYGAVTGLAITAIVVVTLMFILRERKRKSPLENQMRL